ncbi:hypothetical protein GCM10025864_44440 [Luteimicrobium album]|uniref:Uncharacterized protein n=1 Tax=Luteimicrobium album TaxID=1054550 RepID=A0ABQ6IAF4_9MICO|nr:hypothetical protein [Luteimicrobium album]GMA26685.1 hypothetical protein GCM10025864_44440 [Luteimicrobium album]
MPVTLVEAKNNTQDDVDVAVIDEFRKESEILDSSSSTTSSTRPAAATP